MFSSTTLLEATSVNESYSINDIVNNESEAYLYQLLEFNSDIQDIEMTERYNYYRTLTELANTSDSAQIALIEEAEGKSFRQRVIDILERLIKLIGKVLASLIGISTDDRTRFENAKKDAYVNAGRGAAADNNKYTFKVFHHPLIVDIDPNGAYNAVGNLTTLLTRNCNNDVTVVNESDREMAYKVMAKKYSNLKSRNTFSGSVKSSEDFMEMVKSDIIYTDTIECTYGEWYTEAMKTRFSADKKNVSAKLSDITKVLKNAKDEVSRNNASLGEEARKYANTALSCIRHIVESYTWFINQVSVAESRHIGFITSTVNRYNANANRARNESGMIHGEPFSSDTLFDNDDMRDFNRTEWLNLALTTECYELKADLTDIYRNIAVQEAIIMADNDFNKFNRLVAMREAEEKKADGSSASIIQRIKAIIEQFFAKVKDRFNANSRYIKKYQAFIDKPVTIQNVTSTGDIITGMYRVQRNLTIAPFDFNGMKEDLKDPKQFFAKRVMPGLNTNSNYSKRTVRWNDDMTITEYCKAYYGASMPEDKYEKCSYTTKEIEANKPNILRYLNQVNLLINNIKSDISKLETESKKINRANKNAGGTTNTQQNTTTGNDTTNNASATKNESMYYSELYGRWFTEAEINNGTATNNQNAQQQDGEKKEEVFNEVSAFKNYMTCYKDVILAKITAAEFITSEMMQIIRAHAESQMSAEQKQASRNETQQNNNQQQNKTN